MSPSCEKVAVSVPSACESRPCTGTGACASKSPTSAGSDAGGGGTLDAVGGAADGGGGGGGPPPSRRGLRRPPAPKNEGEVWSPSTGWGAPGHRHGPEL